MPIDPTSLATAALGVWNNKTRDEAVVIASVFWFTTSWFVTLFALLPLIGFTGFVATVIVWTMADGLMWLAPLALTPTLMLTAVIMTGRKRRRRNGAARRQYVASLAERAQWKVDSPPPPPEQLAAPAEGSPGLTRTIMTSALPRVVEGAVGRIFR